MSTARACPPEQPAAQAGASPAASAAAAAEVAPPPAAADAAPNAAAAPEAAAAQPLTVADAVEKLADMEKNWVGILERVTVHVDAAEERLQRQLAEEAEPGWQPAPHQCSGVNKTPRGSAAAVALSWWQHSDRCLNAAVGRGEDLKSLEIFQTKMRGALQRMRGEQAATTARLAATEAGGQRAKNAAGASTSASTAAPTPTRSELAKLKWLMGGLAAAAARMDALVDRTTAMAAQTQELADAAKKTAADKLAVYLHQALEGEAARQRRREQAAAAPTLPLPGGGFGLGAAEPLAAFGVGPAGGFGGFGARPYGGYGGNGAQRFGGYAVGAGAQYGGGIGLGQAPAGRPAAGLFDHLMQQQAGVGQAVDQVGARLNQFAQQLEQQLGQQGRLGQQLAQVRAAAVAAGLQRRPAGEERPPEWAPPEQRQQAEAEHSRSARLRAMLDIEQEDGDGEAQPGSASREGSEGGPAGDQQDQAQGLAAAGLAAEPSVLSRLSASPGATEEAERYCSKGQADEEPTEEEEEWALLMNATREVEEGQQAQAAQGAKPEVQPVAAARAGAAAVEAPAVGSLSAAAGTDHLTEQQREYIAAQRRRFAMAKQAGEAPPPAVQAAPSPPAAPAPASWQPRLPLAPRSVLPPVVEAARAAQQGAKGRAASGLENSYHSGTRSCKAGGPGRPSTLAVSANKAAGAAAIACAEGLGARPAPSWLGDDTRDDNVEASSGRRSKLRFVRRLFPGLSCFLPEDANH